MVQTLSEAKATLDLGEAKSARSKLWFFRGEATRWVYSNKAFCLL